MDDWKVALLAAGIGLIGAWGGARLAFKSQAHATQVAEQSARMADFTTRALNLAGHRVAWIQRLRDEMACFQSWGMTPNLDQMQQREFYEHGTRIELLMNPHDEDYATLQGLMYRLLIAESMTEKYSVNAEYVEVCQRILKREWEVAKGETLGEPAVLGTKNT